MGPEPKPWPKQGPSHSSFLRRGHSQSSHLSNGWSQSCGKCLGWSQVSKPRWGQAGPKVSLQYLNKAKLRLSLAPVPKSQPKQGPDLKWRPDTSLELKLWSEIGPEQELELNSQCSQNAARAKVVASTGLEYQLETGRQKSCRPRWS